jgi:predicted molibdopterin-dependent oxidoreductase YjgC
VLPKGTPANAIILPIATFAEEEGTFTNLRGRVQRFLQAKGTPGMTRPSWFVTADLLTAVGEKAEYFTASAAFDALAKAEAPFAGMNYDALALKGTVVAGMMAEAK